MPESASEIPGGEYVVMANRHFGKLSDVWKHAALAEVLEREAPLRYAETHAGSGAYPIVQDGERQFGILRFLDVAARCEVLARCRYRAVAAACLDLPAGKPGLVHVDPFDPDARGPGGCSALELAARVADSGTGLVYWYGYEQHGAQGEAHKQLAALTTAPLWCGEVTVTGANDSLGEFDHSATLCTVGVILANVREGTAGACAALGNALSDAYADAVLPDGAPG